MDALTEYLLSAKDRASPRGDELRGLGKRAAMQYLTSGTLLTDTVAKLSKEAGLNYEQVRRVVESANNETFAQLFQKGYDKNVTFPLADHGAVIQQLQAIGAPVEKTAAYRPAEPRQHRYIPGGELVSLDYLLGGGMVKAAEAASPTNTSKKLGAMLIQHKELAKTASADMQGLGTEFFAKLSSLKVLVKQAMLDGNPSWAVGASIAAAGPSVNLYGLLQSELGSSLMQRPSLLKMAQEGMIAQPDPQITGLVQELEQIGQKMVAAEETMTRAKAVISELLDILRGSGDPSAAASVFLGNQGIAQPPVDPSQGMPMQPGMMPQQ